jgi:amidohydrolase
MKTEAETGKVLALKRVIDGQLAKYAGDIDALATAIFKNPELGFEERKACDLQVGLLKQWGFEVTSPFAGLDTAYVAVWGKGKPTFCFMGEYDALPDIGHACGHNLICSAAIGAGCALRDVMKRQKIPGRIVIMGTPAEESKGGKLVMIRNGALRGLDAVLEAHPSYRTTPDSGSTAIRRLDVRYFGKAAHAAGSPELGRNALDGVMLLFQGVNAWRQHMTESNRVHGIVTDGGVAPNIIPERAAARFFLRSLDDNDLAEMLVRFRAIARGAALMTGTRLVLKESSTGYKARLPNTPLNEAYIEAAGVAGLKPVIPEKSGRGSSDFGDVSHEAPGAHVYFGIGRQKIASHSVAFREAAGSPYGRRQMLAAANALAAVGYRYFTDADFRRRVAADFRAATAKRKNP